MFRVWGLGFRVIVGFRVLGGGPYKDSDIYRSTFGPLFMETRL